MSSASNRSLHTILPVIDLLEGQVVRGVAGQRDQYQAIQSQISKSADPTDIAQALVNTFHFSQCYVADLDAIENRSFNLKAIQAISEAGLGIWLDAGIGSVAKLDQLKSVFPIDQLHSVVIGLETLESFAMLQQFIAVCGIDRVVLSLDLKEGKPLSCNPELQQLSPLEIAAQAIALGVQRLILLDLAQVGTGNGTGTSELCQQLSSVYPNLELITGGGISSMSEVQQELQYGASQVLVASALHDGRIS